MKALADDRLVACILVLCFSAPYVHTAGIVMERAGSGTWICVGTFGCPMASASALASSHRLVYGLLCSIQSVVQLNNIQSLFQPHSITVAFRLRRKFVLKSSASVMVRFGPPNSIHRRCFRSTCWLLAAREVVVLYQLTFWSPRPCYFAFPNLTYTTVA